MKACRLFIAVMLSFATMTDAFVLVMPTTIMTQKTTAQTTTTTRLFVDDITPAPSRLQRASAAAAAPQTVQVCGFKDCKRSGGGARLEKLIKEVRCCRSFPCAV